MANKIPTVDLGKEIVFTDFVQRKKQIMNSLDGTSNKLYEEKKGQLVSNQKSLP